MTRHNKPDDKQKPDPSIVAAGKLARDAAQGGNQENPTPSEGGGVVAMALVAGSSQNHLPSPIATQDIDGHRPDNSFSGHSPSALGSAAISSVAIPRFNKVAGSAAQRMRQAVDYFQTKDGGGFTREQAIGIAANIKQESEFNPGAVGDGGSARGIAQWHSDRQKNFHEVFGRGLESSTYEQQLAFITHELTRGTEVGAGKALRQTSTAREAAAVVSSRYERPRAVEWEKGHRANIATAIERQLFESVPDRAVKSDFASLKAKETLDIEQSSPSQVADATKGAKLTHVTPKGGGDAAKNSPAPDYMA